MYILNITAWQSYILISLYKGFFNELKDPYHRKLSVATTTDESPDGLLYDAKVKSLVRVMPSEVAPPVLHAESINQITTSRRLQVIYIRLIINCTGYCCYWCTIQEKKIFFRFILVFLRAAHHRATSVRERRASHPVSPRAKEKASNKRNVTQKGPIGGRYDLKNLDPRREAPSCCFSNLTSVSRTRVWIGIGIMDWPS